MLKSYLKYATAGLSIVFILSCGSQREQFSDEGLKIKFKGNAKVEVGGPYAGIELHHSSPLLQRISFFYPVANSLDESTDYWKRDTSFIMKLGLKVGDDEKEIIGKQPFEFDLTPYSVSYYKTDSNKSIDISYRFTRSKPSVVIRYEIKNERNRETQFEFYTHLETAVRTSHSYNLIDKAWTEYDSINSVLYTNFDDQQTGSAELFIVNAAEKPFSFSTESHLTGLKNPDDDWWTQKITRFANDLIPKDKQARPAARFLYKKLLKPQESMVIIQIVGSCKQAEGKNTAGYLTANYEDEIKAYEQAVLKKAFGETKLTSGDPVIDQSVYWAKAILEANTHYLDGVFVPMPCPAEYNFYFTHDVLKTDLAAVNFDISRVKRDLNFIIDHANEEKIIPHAYYWKDSAYTTELAAHDNWNNFWIIIVSGSYIRHSGDTTFARNLYPYIQKSLEQALKTKGSDDLMWSNMPDWWDIGKIYGQRSYMTILAVKAIREYVFISTMLGNNLNRLPEYENLADRMQHQLNNLLWSDSLKYLINYYEPGKVDDHYYIGSLLAAHYGLLDKTRTAELVKTAKIKLLDEKVGIYNVFPMDFNQLREYLKFSGNEAGDPFLYANGGIWPHGNAWYALALMAEGNKPEALNFIKTVMTLQGVISGPNGQPAMYEVRNGNFHDSSVYGTVDKPQFLWAAGWYLYSLYHLFAVEENEWNIRFDPYIPEEQNNITLDLFLSGKLSKVYISGRDSSIKKILYDGEELPTAVIPFGRNYNNIEIYTGFPLNPYLKNSKSVLKDCRYDNSTGVMSLETKSFPGHKDEIVIVSPYELSKLLIDNNPYHGRIITEKRDGVKIIKIGFIHQSYSTRLELEFNK